MFDWQRLGEALGSLADWDEARAEVQEGDADRKWGARKLWIKV